MVFLYITTEQDYLSEVPVGRAKLKNYAVVLF